MTDDTEKKFVGRYVDALRECLEDTRHLVIEHAVTWPETSKAMLARIDRLMQDELTEAVIARRWARGEYQPPAEPKPLHRQVAICGTHLKELGLRCEQCEKISYERKALGSSVDLETCPKAPADCRVHVWSDGTGTQHCVNCGKVRLVRRSPGIEVWCNWCGRSTWHDTLPSYCGVCKREYPLPNLVKGLWNVVAERG